MAIHDLARKETAYGTVTAVCGLVHLTKQSDG
jgi:hypothetical protein